MGLITEKKKTKCGKNANIIINNQQNYLFLPRAVSHKYCILSFKYKAFSTVCLGETGNL